MTRACATGTFGGMLPGMKPARTAAAEAHAESPAPPASETRAAGPKLSAREALRFVREHEDPQDAAALLEAGERYVDDADGTREVEDIQAGRHPLQRDGRNLDAWQKFESRLAAIRARCAD